jgi:hypothetical protein
MVKAMFSSLDPALPVERAIKSAGAAGTIKLSEQAPLAS